MSLYSLLLKVCHAVLGNRAILAALRSEQLGQQATLNKILAAVTPSPVAAIHFDVDVEGTISTGVQRVQIKDSEQFTITIVPVDSKGNPSSINPTKTTFTIDNPAVAALTPGADGLSCAVAGSGVGSAQIQATVTDANNPADTVSGTLALTVVAGDTASLALNTSAPVAQ